MLRLIADKKALRYDYRTHGDYGRHAQTEPLLVQGLAHLNGRPWRFLDLGGGAGLVTDFLLGHFAQAQGVVLDASPSAIAANVPHPRKTCLCASADEILSHFEPGTFDVILAHDFLHHVVTGRYRSSGQAVDSILQQARHILAPGGRLSVLEQCYDGWFDNWPGRLIFSVTSSRLLRGLAHRLGAVTAGVGVRFQSERAWRQTFHRCGFRIKETPVAMPFGRRWILDALLGLRRGATVHFWCQPTVPAASSNGP